jgi:hypothetical protein
MKMRKALMFVAIVIAVPLVAIIGYATWVRAQLNTGEPLVERSAVPLAKSFAARALVAASDADMLGTAYVDGVLQPIEGTHDSVSRIDIDKRSVQTSDLVTNSVTGWPGTLELSPDGKYAYVIESRGSRPANVDRVDNVHKDLLEGRLLTTVDLNSEMPKVVRTDDIAIDPTSVAVAPNGKWLAIAARDDESPITFVMLDDGVPIAVRHPLLSLPPFPPPPPEATAQESLAGVSYLRIAPNGRTIAIHIQSTYLIFGEVIFDADGNPAKIRLGPPMQLTKCMSVGRWSLDGRHYIVSDTNWGPTPGDTFVAGPGELVSLAVEGFGAKVVSRAQVSLSPEGMEMSRDGSLFVAVNMERTFYPETFPFDLIPRRQQASLSLVSFDASSGQLKVLDGPIAFNGVLPEDAVFDRDADMLAVAIFHDRVAKPMDGWIEMFAIDRSGGLPKIVPTGQRIRLPRGVHDLAVVY